MRIVAQRVTHASVTIDGKVKSEIGLGMLVLLGIEEADNEEDIEWLCAKLSKLRTAYRIMTACSKIVAPFAAEIFEIFNFFGFT